MQVPHAGSGDDYDRRSWILAKLASFFTYSSSLLLRLLCDEICMTLDIRAEKASNLCILADHTVKMAA
jgi:hypothetical protein